MQFVLKLHLVGYYFYAKSVRIFVQKQNLFNNKTQEVLILAPTLLKVLLRFLPEVDIAPIAATAIIPYSMTLAFFDLFY